MFGGPGTGPWETHMCTCPGNDVLAPLTETEQQQAEKRRRQMCHDKYVAKHQRTEQYETQPSRRSRAPVSRAIKDLDQMSAYDLCKAMVEDGILVDMSGQACRTCGSGKLGHMKATKEATVPASAVKSRNVFHRCNGCRIRVCVTDGNKLFTGLGHGGVSLNDVVAIWAMEVEGYSTLQIMRHHNVSDKTVAKWTKVAREIMERHAVALQSERWPFPGREDNLTVDIEADESVFAKWKDYPKQPGEKVIHYYWPWIGMMIRGDPASLWLRPLAVRHSVGEGRLPQLTADLWKSILDDTVGPTSKVVLMTDSAPSFVNVSHKGTDLTYQQDRSSKVPLWQTKCPNNCP